MLNFHTILFVAVTVAFPTVSAIPASAIGNGLTNFLPAVGLPSKAILSDLPIGVVNDAATDDGFSRQLRPSGFTRYHRRHATFLPKVKFWENSS